MTATHTCGDRSPPHGHRLPFSLRNRRISGALAAAPGSAVRSGFTRSWGSRKGTRTPAPHGSSAVKTASRASARLFRGCWLRSGSISRGPHRRAFLLSEKRSARLLLEWFGGAVVSPASYGVERAPLFPRGNECHFMATDGRPQHGPLRRRSPYWATHGPAGLRGAPSGSATRGGALPRVASPRTGRFGGTFMWQRGASLRAPRLGASALGLARLRDAACGLAWPSTGRLGGDIPSLGHPP